MANIVPAEIDAAARRGHAAREIETLELLEMQLSSEYTIYHGVHWASAADRPSIYGEIDFIVIDRLGRAVAIEQKNGEVTASDHDLIKQYPSGAKGVQTQLTRNLNHLRSEFRARHPGRQIDIEHLLYLPDATIAGPPPSSIDPHRIIDARTREQLAARVAEILEAAASAPTARAGTRAAEPCDIHQFLSDLVDIVPSVDAASRLASSHYRQLSGGLGTWARRLELDPHRLRVIGTAGSGKTQLALEELHAARQAGKTALYVCFNRPLADAMRMLAPVPGSCQTFHELCAWTARQRGATIDWSRPGIFEELARSFIQSAPAMHESVDLLIIDEGQDFEAAWAQALLQLVRADGRAFWLEDPSQNLYRREPLALSGWALLRSPVNHRSPHVLVALANALGLTEEPQQAGGAVHGFDPMIHSYVDPESLVAQTSAAVRELVDAGHAPADIAVLAWHGMTSSQVIDQGSLGGLATRRFTRRYTQEGTAILTDGELALDTLFRFKGQAADCVVLTEIDFTEWNEDAKRRLFVGLTRARLKLTLIASTRAEELICERLAHGSRPIAM